MTFFSDFDNARLESQLAGDRFFVTYRLSGNENEARTKARDICAEQSVEFPVELLPPGAIPEKIVGRIEEFRRETEGTWLATISFAEEIAGGEFTQFLNVIFGNISIKAGIQVARIVPSQAIYEMLPGPRFGVPGIRQILGERRSPPLFTALKPMGLSARNFAGLASTFVKAGIEIVKDDHGLSDQVFAPFEDRVRLCAGAVNEANAKFGRKSIYVPNITGPLEKLLDRAHRARELGAGGLMISPGLTGIDGLRMLAQADPGLPLFAHPSFIGSYVMHREQGIACGVFFGAIMRLAGADATIFPNYGGRFPLSQADCMDIATGCREPMGGLKPIFPSPAGGMELTNIAEMVDCYGNDMLVLVGSGLFRLGGDLVANVQRFRKEILEMCPK